MKDGQQKKLQEGLVSEAGAMLYRPGDIVQLEHMISADCLW